MPSAEEFDEFYVTTRRRLVLQTFALTGDLGASRSAVRDAYVAARHHWNKVGRMAEPEHWVRPRAWTIAQRRHTARPWHREKSLSEDQADLLDALHKLTDVQRKTLVLTHLAAVGLADIGREIGETQQRAEHHLQAATAAVALQLDIDSTAIRGRLEALAPVADAVKLPRAPIIRRSGLRRRRTHAVVGSALAVLVTIGAGALVVPEQEDPARPAQRELVPRKMLLTATQVAPLAAPQAWQVTDTSKNTDGTGINTICQPTRFADDDGIGAWVRTFAAPTPARGLVQTVEISSSPGAARTTYDTTLGWYAGCTDVARIRLLDTYVVSGLGEQAQVLRMQIPSPKQPRSFLVGLARSGALTTSTVLETHTRTPGPPSLLVPALAAAVENLCDSPVAGDCVGAPAARPTLPPPSGETAGMLAIVDLPAVANVAFPWVGTDPVPVTVNAAATTCDEADFARAGARDARTRTYLIPEAKLPRRFGLTETLGEFPTARAASRFVTRITDRMRTCPDRELASTVSDAVVRLKGPKTGYALWRLENQVNQREDKVPFWMGVARVGRYVAQVNLTPVERYDIDRQTFQALVVRARDRLHEVGP